MANRYKDPDELNNRYRPEDDDEIPEEELTEEERDDEDSWEFGLEDNT